VSLNYDVVVNYRSTGDLGGPLAKLGGMTQQLGALKSIGSEVSSALQSTALQFAAIEAGAQLVAGAFDLIKKGVADVNAGLEEMQIGLAVSFGVGGIATSFEQGMSDASVMMKQLRTDAQSLPGTFEDLAKMFQTISIAGFKAGMDPEKVRQFTDRTMALAHVANIPENVAGREMAAMLSGNARAQSILASRIFGLHGEGVKAYNQMSPQKQQEFISKTIFSDTFNDALKAYMHSWVGLTTTMVSKLRMLLGDVTHPLFNNLKNGLEKSIHYFDEHKQQISEWSNRVGQTLARWFDIASEKIHSWLPPLIKIGAILERFIENLDSGHIKKWAGEMAGMTAGRMLLGGALGAGLENVGSFGKMGAGGISGASGIAGLIGATSALEILGGAGLLLVPIVLGIYGAFRNLTDAGSRWYGVSLDLANSMRTNLVGAFEDAQGKNTALSDSMKELSEFIGFQLIGSLSQITFIFRNWADLIGGIRDAFKEIMPKKLADKLDEIGATPVGLAHREQKFRAPGYTEDKPIKVLMSGVKPPEVPAHNTHIQKVEIVVNSNQDPSRIARLTRDEIANLQRHPKIQRAVPNFSLPPTAI
jgi:hypothetical protein